MNWRMLIGRSEVYIYSLSKGSFFLNTGITCASLSLFGRAEVANEWFINFASRSKIVLLQDFMSFAELRGKKVLPPY